MKPRTFIALGAAATVALLSPAVASAAFPGANGKIAFGFDDSLNSGIWTMGPSGANKAPAISEPGWLGPAEPAWSPDGLSLAFTREGDVYTRRWSGGTETRLTNDILNTGGPAWSPDGAKIVYSNSDGTNNPEWPAEVDDLFVVGANGGAPTNITAGGVEGREHEGGPRWSPTGGEIAYNCGASGSVLLVTRCGSPGDGGRIMAISASGGTPRVIVSGPFVGSPDWSPDGRKLVFTMYNDATSDDVYTVNADGTGLVRLTSLGGPEDRPVWSPDGKQIVFELNDDIFKMNADGSGVVNLTNTAHVRETQPDWQAVKPECSDGTDNDGDGKVDYPADGGCSSATDTTERGTNLAKNAGFETDANADGRPDSWSSTSRFTRSSTVKSSGTYAGRHRATDNSSYTVSQTVSGLSGGQRYYFAGKTNIPATTDAFSYKLQVSFRNSSYVTLSTTTVGTYTAATGWSTRSASMTAPTGTTNAQVKMVLSSLNATVYADEFFFGRE